MADSSAPQHSGPTSGDSSSMPPADWCAEQWSVLCDLLDVSDPREVVSRVRRLSGQDASTPDAVEEVVQEMQSQLQSLQERNQDLIEQLQSDSSPTETDPQSADAEALLNHLDVSSMSQARERVESLTQQLDHLYREKEQLAEAGLMNADDVLDELDRLQKKCDRLEEDQNASPASSSSPSTSPSPAAVLDVTSFEIANTVTALATEAHGALDQTARNLDLEPPASPVDAATFPDTVRSLRDCAVALRDETATGTSDTQVDDILGISTSEEAQELATMVRRMSETLDTLRDERETLKEELGVATSTDLLDLVDSMETQLSAIYERQEQDAAVQDEVEDVLGISTVEEAHELADLVHRMDAHLETVAGAHESLAEAGYDAETALATIHNMEEQLVSLYEERDDGTPTPSDTSEHEDLVDAVTEILGLTTPEEVEQMNASVRQMSTRLDTLRTEHDILSEANLTAKDAVEMIDNMNDQLSSLYKARDERSERLSRQIQQLGTTFGFEPPENTSPETALDHLTDAAESLLATASHPLPESNVPDNLAAAVHVLMAEMDAETDPEADPAAQEELETIKNQLGISTPEEAEELAEITRDMSNRLEALQDDYKHLEEAGISSAKSAVEMVESLSAQLDELYEEQELLQQQSSPTTEQDTFEQLASLYSEQEKLERALGLSSAEEIIEMVEALTAQLDDLYSDRDETAAPEPDLETPSFQVEPTANGTETDAQDAASPLADPDYREQILSSLKEQLEALYSEKEALLDLGIPNAKEAAGKIDDLQTRLQTLQNEHEQCQNRLERLESELGTSKVPEIVEMATAPDSGTNTEPVPEAASETAQSEAPDATPPEPAPVEESPPSASPPALLPENTLHEIDELNESALDDLSVGALRLDDDGRIEYLNEEARQLPGLNEAAPRSELLGEVLFQIVPSTSNTLFLNRFRTGVDDEQMDARFSYTFVSPQQPPTAFFVHLYRAGSAGANWLLFEPAE